MYYIVELADGTTFASNYIENLPEEAVGFSVINAEKSDVNGYPTNYHVKIGETFQSEDGIERAYFNGGIIVVPLNTGFVKNNAELNNTLKEIRAYWSILYR